MFWPAIFFVGKVQNQNRGLNKRFFLVTYVTQVIIDVFDFQVLWAMYANIENSEAEELI